MSKLSFNSVYNFIAKLPTPEYGYKNHLLEGIGFLLMGGAKISISLIKTDRDNHSLGMQLLKKITGIALAFLSLPLTLIGATFKAIGSRFPVKLDRDLFDNDISPTNPEKIEQIYDLLKIISSLCNERGIPYFLDAGTMIGAARHGGIIPWDDDADICMMKQDIDRFLRDLRPHLEAHGIELEQSHIALQDMYKFHFKPEILSSRYHVYDSRDIADLDLQLVEDNGQGKIVYSSNFVRNQYPTQYFTREELSDLAEWPFGPNGALRLKGIRDPRRYLDAMYGSEWSQYAVQTHSHTKIGSINVPILVLTKTKHRIRETTSCAQGSNHWRGAPLSPFRPLPA